MKLFIAFTLLMSLFAPLTRATETEVLFNGTGIGDWSTSRDEQRLAKELILSELVSVSDPVSLRWRFIPRGIGFNDIFLQLPVARRFDTIRLHVKNEGAGFTLASKVRDAHGAEWTAKGLSLKANEDWR